MSMLSDMEPMFLDQFRKYGEEHLPLLVNGNISSKVFLSAYKRCKPLEDMDTEEKTELKKMAIEMFPEKNQEELIDACRIIYTIGVLL